MYTHGSPVCFRSHVIGDEPIAINYLNNIIKYTVSVRYVRTAINIRLKRLIRLEQAWFFYEKKPLPYREAITG